MPILETEWASISRLIEKVAANVCGKRQDYFVTGQVIRVDKPNHLIYMAEFGDQPVPVVAWNYMVDYYDTDSTGAVKKKTANVTPAMPKVGDIVLVARELGARRLPRALGIIQGTNWVVPEDE